jgi:hypothetical protein
VEILHQVAAGIAFPDLLPSPPQGGGKTRAIVIR